MDTSFWHSKWQQGDIGFHEADVNPLLIRHWPALKLPQAARIFVPLCGKTRDIGWLLAAGYSVVGAELSELAVSELFAELDLTPDIISLNTMRCYHADRLTIFVGDIFALTAAMLGTVDAIYDRAALVALPADMRLRYANQLIKLTAAAPQLVITYEYDQRLMPGPPFSVDEEDIYRLYAAQYRLTSLNIGQSTQLKGSVDATNRVWLLNALRHGGSAHGH